MHWKFLFQPTFRLGSGIEVAQKRNDFIRIALGVFRSHVFGQLLPRCRKIPDKIRANTRSKDQQLHLGFMKNC